jgi:phosphate transport system permease protein
VGRRFRNITFWSACTMAFLLIAAPALSMLISVFHQAFPAIGWSLLTQRTNGIGIQNAILGTLLLLLAVLILAGGVGMAGGIYLAEFATGRHERVLRFFSEILAGMPSIVIGYIGYITLVVQFHWGFSLLAAVLALSVLVLPYVVKTTELALRQVPSFLREAAAGLGLSETTTVWRILIPPALPGIVSGLIVALAISTGELAPLLFTAGSSDQNPSLALTHHPLNYLTNVIFTDLSLPGVRDHATSAAAGAATLVILLVLIFLGRIVSRRARRSTARMSL